MSIAMRRFVFYVLMVIGLPAAILVGVFLFTLAILYPISYIMGWI